MYLFIYICYCYYSFISQGLLMKKSLLSLISLCIILTAVQNLFSIELGRGIIQSSTTNELFVKKLEDATVITITVDANTQIDLITGETVSFENAKLYPGLSIEYIIDGSKLISAIVDFGGLNGEYVVAGGMDFFNVSNQTCRVNGTRFKFAPNIKFRSRGKDVSPTIIQNTDLVKVLYTKDPINDENVATVIEIVSGTYNDFKRTSVIRKVTVNELIIGDPVFAEFQEQIILNSSTRIYDENFESGSRSLLKPGTIIDVYSLYDSLTSANMAYEIHVKPHPMLDEFYFTGRPLTASGAGITTEFGFFSFIPSTKFTDFSGDAINLTDILQGEARYFSANIVKSGADFNITATKEIPTIQTETTFEGTITTLPNSPTAQGILAECEYHDFANLKQKLVINQSKTFLKGHFYNALNGRTARVTTCKGSNANLKSRVLNETMAIEATDPVNPGFIIGVITESSGSKITINDMVINLNGNTSYTKIDGSAGNITDFIPGNFAVIELFPGIEFLAKAAYRFNSLEIIGRMNDVSNESITVSGLNLPVGDYTFIRGQGNQVTETNKILTNSVVKVVSLHGAAEAITKFTGKGFPTTTTSSTIARFVYVLDGPVLLSTNETPNQTFVFPNPSSTTVSINTPNDVVSDITISTILGEKVLSKSNVSGIAQFSIASLPIGQYIVKVSNSKSSFNQMLQVIR